MTKEEKDKRFLFDLIMGVFPLNDDRYVIFNDFNDNILDIENILAFNGFSQIYSYTDGYGFGVYETGPKKIMKIDMIDKSFQIFNNLSIRDLPFHTVFAKVPEYISDYVISHNCKIYTVGVYV